MRTTKLKLLAAIARCLLAASASQANIIITNPGFEDVPVGGYFVSGVSGWTGSQVSLFPLTMDNSYPQAYGGGGTPYGNQFAAIGAIDESPEASYLQQSISGFTAGATYRLSFAMTSEGYWSPGSSDTLAVSFVTGSSSPATFVTAPPRNPIGLWNNWVNQTVDFVATSAR